MTQSHKLLGRWLPIVNDHPINHPAHLLPLEIRLMMTSPSLTPKPTPAPNSTQPSGATQALTDHEELLKTQKTAHNAVSTCYLAYKEPQLYNQKDKHGRRMMGIHAKWDINPKEVPQLCAVWCAEAAILRPFGSQRKRTTTNMRSAEPNGSDSDESAAEYENAEDQIRVLSLGETAVDSEEKIKAMTKHWPQQSEIRLSYCLCM
ncbi:hypothetical protein H4Q26_007243 [Puccinia striiformis f. sp. tritici PST-130]|nr:hypothetical protein H4Q26_007243 [Puccinia striiformis f. sp. tritici PST-130]